MKGGALQKRRSNRKSQNVTKSVNSVPAVRVQKCQLIADFMDDFKKATGKGCPVGYGRSSEFLCLKEATCSPLALAQPPSSAGVSLKVSSGLSDCDAIVSVVAL